jgi:hypothetical protein
MGRMRGGGLCRERARERERERVERRGEGRGERAIGRDRVEKTECASIITDN